MRYHLTHTRKAKIKKRIVSGIDNMEQPDSHTLLVEFGSLIDSQIVKYRVTTWSSNSIPRYIPEELKVYAHTRMFIVVLVLIVKKWKQPICLSTDEWIIKMYSIHTMEYYLSIKTNEVLIHATHGRTLKMWR